MKSLSGKLGVIFAIIGLARRGQDKLSRAARRFGADFRAALLVRLGAGVLFGV